MADPCRLRIFEVQVIKDSDTYVHEGFDCVWEIVLTNHSWLLPVSIWRILWPATYSACRLSTKEPCTKRLENWIFRSWLKMSISVKIRDFPQSQSMMAIEPHCALTRIFQDFAAWSRMDILYCVMEMTSTTRILKSVGVKKSLCLNQSKPWSLGLRITFLNSIRYRLQIWLWTSKTHSLFDSVMIHV